MHKWMKPCKNCSFDFKCWDHVEGAIKLLLVIYYFLRHIKHFEAFDIFLKDPEVEGFQIEEDNE